MIILNNQNYSYNSKNNWKNDLTGNKFINKYISYFLMGN